MSRGGGLYEASRPIPLTDREKKNEEAVRENYRRRIEFIVGEAIIIGPANGFYRLYNDPRVEKWIEEIIKCDSDTKARLSRRLATLPQLVLKYVESPDAAAHSLARLEGARGTKIGTPFQEKMTVSCLAEGFGLDVGSFIRHVKEIAKSLKKLSRRG